MGLGPMASFTMSVEATFVHSHLDKVTNSLLKIVFDGGWHGGHFCLDTCHLSRYPSIHVIQKFFDGRNFLGERSFKSVCFNIVVRRSELGVHAELEVGKGGSPRLGRLRLDWFRWVTEVGSTGTKEIRKQTCLLNVSYRFLIARWRKVLVWGKMSCRTSPRRRKGKGRGNKTRMGVNPDSLTHSHPIP